MMKKTTVITVAALRSCSFGLAPCELADGTVLILSLPHALRTRRPDITASEKARSPLRRGRPDESVLHEELRFLTGPADHLEGSLIEGVAGLRLSRDSLFHRLEGHRGRLPGEHVDLIHRGHDVRLVEALFLG